MNTREFKNGTVVLEKEVEIVDVLLKEVAMLNELIQGAQEPEMEELKQERMLLIGRINNLLGTDHVLPGSKMRVINNELNNN